MKRTFMSSAILPVFFIIHFFSDVNDTFLISSKTDTSKVHILLLMDDDYGANFNVNDESMNIAELFESFNWQCSIVSIKDTVQPCEGAVQIFKRGPVATDHLISEITDLSQYQALVILPGRSYKNLLTSNATMELIRTAAERGMVIAAWCRGVSVLAAADVIRGVMVTGHSDYIDEYRKAGAEYIPEETRDYSILRAPSPISAI